MIQSLPPKKNPDNANISLSENPKVFWAKCMATETFIFYDAFLKRLARKYCRGLSRKDLKALTQTSLMNPGAGDNIQSIK